jgi:glucose-6-phosphate 1-epimerase
MMVGMDAAALRQQFKVPGVTFDEVNGLTRVQVTTKAATAAIYLQGAHLTAWQPAGFEPAIFLSHKSDFAVGKPIRGGIPIVFPWFAADRKKDRIDGHPGPSHGFARIQDWTLESVNIVGGKGEHNGDTVNLVFTLGPTAMSRSMGYPSFALRLEFDIDMYLQMVLTVTNTGKEVMSYEEAFHSYFEVADIHEVSVDGLETTSFIDKTDAMKVKPAELKPIQFTQTLDRVYNDTSNGITIHDVAGRREIFVNKFDSNTTVVWNPFGPLPDLGEWDWHSMCAVEVANVGDDAIKLAPGKSWQMHQHVSLKKV